MISTFESKNFRLNGRTVSRIGREKITEFCKILDSEVFWLCNLFWDGFLDYLLDISSTVVHIDVCT